MLTILFAKMLNDVMISKGELECDLLKLNGQNSPNRYVFSLPSIRIDNGRPK